MKENDVFPTDVKSINDLKLFPVLTKNIIKDNWDDFKPKKLDTMRYRIGSTGGTTGTPFTYRYTKQDWMLGGCLLYRGWGYGGYNLGDKMIFLGGSSIGITNSSPIEKVIHERLRNIRKLSSFEMSEKRNMEYAETIMKFGPKFIRGYPSSIHHFGKWLKNKDLNTDEITAVFTTSEKLFDGVKKDIARFYNCEVFDNYGLNDGGVSAYECSHHNGMHIDTERSILEIVDESETLTDGEGKIVATSLYNNSMPLIRYETGDVGSITSEPCNCGMHHYILNSIIGRSVDILQTPDGVSVHGWFFLYIFWEYGNTIKEYQIIQNTLTDIDIFYIPGEEFSEGDLEVINAIVKQKSPMWNVNFIEVSSINRTDSGKYKFIINKMTAFVD
ncbi:MAG: phenylacetate--CoA ligase family protein [Eubacteriales bacterium]